MDKELELSLLMNKFLSGGTPSTKNHIYWNGDIPWMTSASINGFYVKSGERYISKEGLDNSATNVVPKYNLLISTRVGVGKVAVNTIDIAISQDLTGAVVDKEQVDPEYLCWYLLSYKPQNYLKSLVRGSTIKGIARSELLKLKVWLPPLPTQNKIAEILSTADTAIQKVDEAIEKTQRLKKGVMHRLLTKGIGHTEFKVTEIGRIPKEWDVKRLNDVAKIRGNRINKKLDNYAFIPMEFVSENDLFAKYVVKNKEEIKSYTYCESGDILLAKITPSLENGKQGIVPENVPGKVALATTEVFPIQCENIYNGFLFYILKMSKYRNVLITSMIGTTGRQRASKDVLEKLNIPVPSLREQKKIFEILQTIDRRLESLTSKKQKLQRVKQGLMNELLTGKREVEV